MKVNANKIAHYFYSDGNELVVFAHEDKLYLRDKDGHYPFDPVHKRRMPNPGEGTEFLDYDYASLGLYYHYEMDGTAWGR